MPVKVKICGMWGLDALHAATEAGAAYVGFVFFPRSPRAILPESASLLARETPAGVCKVGLFVNPDDADLESTLDVAPLDMIQLHGAETPERVEAVRARFGLPVMKAVAIATAEDLPALDIYEEVADQILCDAKPKPGEPLPGGNGVAFDWTLIQGRRWRRPWMLAGGLTAETLPQATALTGAAQVDVSSGVERGPGEKDPDAIRAFLAAAERIETESGEAAT